MARAHTSETHTLVNCYCAIGKNHKNRCRTKKPCPHQWQPIETAPPTSYDGDHVLTLCTQGRYPVFQTEAWVAKTGESTGRDYWTNAQGWVTPTHWMPLLPLPEAEHDH